MTFIPASELKKQFEVYGEFYEYSVGNQSFKMRGQARILRKELELADVWKVDCIVIMVNPGSCTPKDSAYIYPPHHEKGKFVKANTDPTQYQLMRLMKRMDYDRLDILNLSDICAGNFTEFQRQFNQLETLGIDSHSIFSIEREEELARLTRHDVPIILGWGTNSGLRNMAITALKALKGKMLYGLEYDTEPYYRHPNPMLQTRCIAWLNDMEEQLKGGPQYV